MNLLLILWKIDDIPKIKDVIKLNLVESIAKCCCCYEFQFIFNAAMPLKLFIGIIVITVISVVIVTSVVWVFLICICKGRRNRAPPKNQSDAETSGHQEYCGNIPSSSDPYTVPPLLATDGSGLVFGYGHLYPDNQRHITEKDILAHIRGENSISENIPLIAARNSQLSTDVDTLPTISIKGSNFDQQSEEEPLHRPHSTSHRQDSQSLDPQRLESQKLESQKLDSQSFYDRITGADSCCNSTDDVVESRAAPSSPHSDGIYCSCPADMSDTSLLKNVTETPQKRSNLSGRTSYKKRVLRRPSHALLRRELDSESFYDTYNNASSSGVESGESSSSSDSVSVTNFEVPRAKSASVLGAV